MKVTIVLQGPVINPSLQYLESGSVVYEFSLPVNRPALSGEAPDERGKVCDWYKIKVWSKPGVALSDLVNNQRVKAVQVVGELIYRSWTNSAGVAGRSLEVRAQSCEVAAWANDVAPTPDDDTEPELASTRTSAPAPIATPSSAPAFTRSPVTPVTPVSRATAKTSAPPARGDYDEF